MNLSFLNRFRISDIYKRFSFLRYLFLKIFQTAIKIIHYFTPKDGKGGVVIISLHKIGDTIFTFPAIKALFEYYPDKKISILCFESGKEIYDYFFENCNTVTLRPEMFSLRGNIAGNDARKIFKSLDPEIIINLSVSMSVGLMFDSHAKEIIGSDREFFKSVYTSFSPLRTAPPLAGIFTDAIKTKIPDVDKYINFPEASFDSTAKILIQPFAGWEAKEWGLNKFIRLAVKLKKKYVVEFVVQEGSLRKEFIDEIGQNYIPINFTKNLTELIHCIETSSLMISNDTGCIYLAANLGKATYTIYGPTAPIYSFPQDSHHSYIQKEIICTPKDDKVCFTDGGRFGCPSFECMRLLSLSDVSDHLEQFLEKLGIQENKFKANQYLI